MKKKLIGILVALAVLGVVAFQVAPALADPAGPLDHVVITPATITMLPNTDQTFTAKAYDAAGVEITTGVNYFWLASAGGTIAQTGVFRSGALIGPYADAVEVIAVQGEIAKTAYASVTINATVGPLDHVTISPDSATVVTAGTKQFSAKAYDAAGIEITGLTFAWSVPVSVGTIDATGKFTAGTEVGSYPDSISVSVTQAATPANITRTDTASVTITATPTPEEEENEAPRPNVNKLTKMFSGFIKGLGFENFYGGQWTVKENGTVNTYKVIPGTVETVSGTTLIVLPNGQTANVTFTLPTDVTILPKNTTLAVGDKVVVVTVNDQVKLVYKIVAPTTTSGNLPPGLRKHDRERDENKARPQGWDIGKKAGWTNGLGDDEDSED